MKTMRNLFLLCAGLSLFACSSDDDATQQLPEGKGAITIKVGLPGSRAIDTTPNNSQVGDNKVELTGTVYVELTATSGGGVKEVGQDGTVTFYGITEPTKVEAWVNGGKTVALTQDLSITAKKTDGDDKTNFNMQNDAESVPAYGSVSISSTNLTTKTETYNGVNYRMYEALVEMSIPVARIEFAVSRTAASEKFSALNLAGVYLDNVKPTNSGSATNYHHKNDVDVKDGETVTYKTTATGEDAILYDYENVPVLSFIVNNAVAPAADQVYAYNIFPGNVPFIKLWFNGAVAADVNDYVVPYQYAVVNSYNSGALTEFEAGKIYRITGLVLNDSNLSTDESGTDADIKYGIDVTVTEAMWDVVDVTGSWTK